MKLSDASRELLDEAGVVVDRLMVLALPDGPLKESEYRSGLMKAASRLEDWLSLLELELAGGK